MQPECALGIGWNNTNVFWGHEWGVARQADLEKGMSCRFLADGFENRVEITKFVDNFILFQENSNN